MFARLNLDMDALRAFVAGFELGGFGKAADRLGRSQSAVNTQLKKLEERVGQPLTKKAGRGLALTEAGETLLAYARRMLELNDEAVDRLRGAALDGRVRLGLPQDYSETLLPAVLGRFARAHPKVTIEVRAERNADVIARTVTGELDLALAWGDGADAPGAERLAELPMVWIGRPEAGLSARNDGPPPLAMFEAPCLFRAAGLTALDRAGVAWRIAFSSPSLAGLWAAAEAGLGVTLRTPLGLPRSLGALDPAASGLLPLPRIALALHEADATPSAAVGRLAEILRETIAEAAAGLSPPPITIAA